MQKKFNFLLSMFLIIAFGTIHARGKIDFSECVTKIIPQTIEGVMADNELTIQRIGNISELTWTRKANKPFTELILSWNASRPKQGHFSFFVKVRHHYWSRWNKIAEWGPRSQKTFSNKKDYFVQSKSSHVAVRRGRLGFDYAVKVIAVGGAELRRVAALSVNTANLKKFGRQVPRNLSSTLVYGVPKRSQWRVPHPSRKKDLCSPTSLSIIVSYLAYKKQIPLEYSFNSRTLNFAEQVRDQLLDIYGNWPLNVAQAYNTTRGRFFYRVERLNNFDELHRYLLDNIPVAVSLRGYLRGCAWPYNNGHFVVVVGWDDRTKCVICVDPAFRSSKTIIRRYPIRDFVKAWGISTNLSYTTIPNPQRLCPEISKQPSNSSILLPYAIKPTETNKQYPGA